MSIDILTTLVHVRVWNKETTLPDVYNKLCIMEQELRGNTLIHAPIFVFYLYPLNVSKPFFDITPPATAGNLSQSKHRECLRGTCPYKLTCLLWPGYFIGLHALLSTWPGYFIGLQNKNK